MTFAVDAFSVTPNNWVELSARLGAAVLFGGAIGWDRQTSHKAAGLRTHMLVSLGSALFVMIPLMTGSSEEAVSRTIQGIATGIGFLGAGEIVHRTLGSGKYKIRGLTSAASIWVTAALGALAGCGLWQVGVIGALFTLIILTMAKSFERAVAEEPANHETNNH